LWIETFGEFLIDRDPDGGSAVIRPSLNFSLKYFSSVGFEVECLMFFSLQELMLEISCSFAVLNNWSLPDLKN